MEDTTERLQQAIAAAREGRLAEARGIAEELTGEDPQNAHAWFLRGILADDQEQQVEYLNQTLAIDPDHQAARKRMDQIQPAVEEEVEPGFDEASEPEFDAAPEPEVVEEVEPEAEEDMTVVAGSAAFMAAAAVDEVVDEEAVEGFFESAPADVASDDTMIAETPFAEEMLAEDVEVEALFGEEPFAEEPEASDDEGLATVIAAAAVLGDEDAPAEFEEAAEDAEEGGLEAKDLAAAAAGAAVLDQASDAWFEEEGGDDLWSKVEAEAVPDWLIEDTSAEADESLAAAELDDTFVTAEADATQEQDLPDWLLDEPEDEWPQEEEIVEEVEPFDDAPETVVAAAAVADEAAEDEAAEDVEEAESDEEEAPEKPKKKSPNRSLEIALVLLIIVAVVVMAALVYLLISPPVF